MAPTTQARLLLAMALIAPLGLDVSRGSEGASDSVGCRRPAPQPTIPFNISADGLGHWDGETAQERPGDLLSASAVAVAPTSPSPTIYAGTWGHGTYRSRDRGRTWRQVDAGTGQVTSMAVYPHDPGSIIAGTANLGVVRITDDGASYASLSAGLPTPDVRSVAVDRSFPSILYAGTAKGLYRSVDDGVTWALFGLAADEIVSIAVDDADTYIVYAGTAANGVQMSSDGGASWINLGLSGKSVNFLYLDPSSTEILYAGTNGGGVVGITLPQTPASAAVERTPGSPAGPRTASARSDTPEPRQVTFEGHDVPRAIVSGPYGGTVIDLKMDPAVPATLYAASSSGVFKTTDGGDSWHATGLSSTTVYALAVDPVDHFKVYAGTRGEGFYRSPDGGHTWMASADSMIQDKIIYTLVVDPVHPQNIYAGGRAANVDGGSSGDWGGGVFKSTDGGTTWRAVNQGLPEGWVYTLAIDPGAPTTLYAGTHSSGVYKSIDGGATWESKSMGLLSGRYADADNLAIRSLAVNPQDPQGLIAGVWGGGGVFETKTGAESWQLAGDGAPRARVRTVAYNPVAPTLTFAGKFSGGALYNPNDELDTHWTPFPDQAQGGWDDFSVVNAIVIDPSDGTTIFMGLSGAGVLRSTDGGMTWKAVNDGLLATSVTAIVSDPSSPSTLYASTNGTGIFRSTDRGASWSSFTWAGPRDWALGLAIEPEWPNTLYVATDTHGIGSLHPHAAEMPACRLSDDVG